MRAGFPKCRDGLTDCFSYCDGRCIVLIDTDFKGRACPFYKEKKWYEKELAEADAREKERGFYT